MYSAPRDLTAVAFLSVTRIVAVGKKNGANYNIAYSEDGGNSWNSAATPPLGSDLESLTFSGSTVIAVGKAGTILRSIDGGASWSSVFSPTGNDLRRATASFIGGDIVIAVGKNGTILRSTDSGVSWNSVASGVIRDLKDLGFSGNTVIAVGKKQGPNFTITRSTNAGASWSTPSSKPGGGKDLEAVILLNPTTAIAVGRDGTILRSTDAGDNWVSVASPTGDDLEVLEFDGDKVVAAGENGTIVYSTDQGVSWTTADVTGGTGQDLNGIAGKGSFVMAVGNAGTILSSTDGGASWNAQASGTLNDLLAVDIINPVVIVGRNGAVLLSTDQPSSGAGAGTGTGAGAESGNPLWAGPGVGGSVPVDVPFGGEWIFALFAAGYGIHKMRD